MRRRRNALDGDENRREIRALDYYFAQHKLRDRVHYDRFSNVIDERGHYSSVPEEILMLRYGTEESPREPFATIDEIASETGYNRDFVLDALVKIGASTERYVASIRREAEQEAEENLARAEAARSEQVARVRERRPGEDTGLYCVVRPCLGRAIFLVEAKMLSPRDRILVAGSWGTCKLVYDRLLDAFPDLEWKS